MAARSVYTISTQKQWCYLLKTWLPASLIGLFCAGLVIYLFGIVPNREIADVRGAMTHHNRGVVSSVSYLPVTKGNTDPGVLASVVVAGDSVIFRTHEDLHQNEPVQVTYRVGKSGRIHIDDIEPSLGTPK